MKLADQIQQDLIKHANGNAYDILIPNFYYGNYEMDLFKLSHPANYITEYEIKISKSDFKADFKKGKEYIRHPELNHTKHDLMASGKCKQNKFFFVVPEGLIKKEDVPPYAGLMYHKKSGFIEIVKPAPFIHKIKPGDEIYKQLSRSLCFREKIWRHKVRLMNRQLLDFKKRKSETLFDTLMQNNNDEPHKTP